MGHKYKATTQTLFVQVKEENVAAADYQDRNLYNNCSISAKSKEKPLVILISTLVKVE